MASGAHGVLTSWILLQVEKHRGPSTSDLTARPAANRGTLSARQLQDIRDLTRIANEGGGTLIMHGVKIVGDKGKAAAGNPQQARPQNDREAVREQDVEHEPMDTDGPPTTPTAAKSNKKEERDARRASENRARARVARWRSLVKRLIYDRIWMPLWKQMLRENQGPKRDARRRMRDALWAEWRRKQFDSGESSSAPPSDSRRLSHRDRWLLRRASKPRPSTPPTDWQLQTAVWLTDAADAGLTADAAEEELLAQAIAESLEAVTDTDAETRSDRSAATRYEKSPGWREA